MASTAPPTQSNFTIFAPNFIIPFWNDEEMCLKEAADGLMEKDWLTPELIDEIDGLSLKDHDIDRNVDNSRSESSFNSAVSTFFTLGQIFASFKQLHQASDWLLTAWAVKIVYFG